MSFVFIVLGVFLMGTLVGNKCLRMCGNIAHFSGYGHQICTDRRFRFSHAIFYNMGRVLNYVIIGVISALLGQLVFDTFSLDWGESGLLICVLSIAMFIVAGFSIAGWTRLLLPVEKLSTLLWKPIRRRFGKRFLGLKHVGDAFGLGCLWSSPCGIVYMIVIIAFFSASPILGGSMMFAFGLGTLPNMMLISRGMAFLPPTWRSQKWFRHIAAFLLVMWGTLFFLTHVALYHF